VDRGRLEHLEQPAEVRDRHDREPPLGDRRGERRADVVERIDVEARVDLVEHRDPGTKDAELDDLVSLALATGQVDVERSLEQVRA
jgi:hypothetical protein